MAAAMIVGAVYNLINAGVVGSLHDTTLLAAVTLGAPILGLVMAVGGVFGVGGGALVSRLLGAAEHEPARADEIKHVTSFALWGAVVAGAVVGALGLLFLQPAGGRSWVRMPSTAPATSAFVGVMLGFVPVLAAAFCLEQLVRAEGAASQVMVGLIASTVAEPGAGPALHPRPLTGASRARRWPWACRTWVSSPTSLVWLAAAQRVDEPGTQVVHPLVHLW